MGRRSLEHGGGKQWRSRMEQNERPGEYYCGIETSVWTAGTGLLSAGVLELWTGVLMLLCQAVLSQIPHC